jgi:DNA-binding NarL/FixJ family response regulator
MVVQARGGRRMLTVDPDEAHEAFDAIESTGRQALTELRRLLGMLRKLDDQPALAPQPSLGRLGELVNQVQEAGLPVQVAVEGEASDGRQAVEAAKRLRPDVVLMDIRMPTLNGLEATRQLVAAAGAPPRVLVLTTFDLDEYVYEALRAGASGFLLKDAPEEQLLAAIRVVAAGGALFAPSVTRRLIEEFSGRLPADRQPPAGLADLTPREVEVLKLLARGLSNAELAQTLYLSENTARTHVARILTKLGLRDRTQAVVLAYECGLVRPGAAGPGADPPPPRPR